MKENDKKGRRFEDFSFEFFGVRWDVKFVDELIGSGAIDRVKAIK